MSSNTTAAPSREGTLTGVEREVSREKVQPEHDTPGSADLEAGKTASAHGPPAKAASSQATENMTDEERRLAQMPKGLQLYLVMLGLLLAVYVVSLDQTIVAPAIPIISNDFNALQDVGWYGSAYFATSTALQPLYGRLYRLSLKWPFISCLVVFEVGSIVCAVAHESKTFIVGRAIAGVGVAGAYIGVLTIISASVPLNKVPVWSGAVGAVYGIGAITGPLIGGVFTSEVTWRWCFWLSLPIGGITIATVLLLYHPPSFPDRERNLVKIFLSLDIPGTVLVLGAVICYLKALQDGGLAKPWSSSQEIGLLVGAGVIVIVFVINEYFQKDNAIIPLRILCSRTIGFSSIANFGIGASYFTVSIVLPIYFQLRGSSSIRSGVQMLALVCGVIFSVSLAGGSAPKIGYVQPVLYLGATIGIIASGLFQLFNEDSRQALWVGLTFMYGIGLGAAFQMPFVISQTWGSGMDTMIGTSTTIFFQTLGGAVIVAASQSVYANIFKQQVLGLPISDQEKVNIVAAGVTGFRHIVSEQTLPLVVHVSMIAVRKAFIFVPVFTGLTLIATVPLPWASISGATAAGGA